jgi:hypothetical protein
MRRVFRTDEHPRLLASPKGDVRDRRKWVASHLWTPVLSHRAAGGT